MLVFNVGFTNADAVAALNPNMMSVFGQLMILVWGLAFIAVSETLYGAVYVCFGYRHCLCMIPQVLVQV